MIGNTLSHYKIIEKLGEGGMGEVYLAEDSRLDRKVALKILPQHLSERAELRERFEREARAVSSLNHPHICTLHDIGEQDGIHYLVMEHLVGETLEARLAKGPLPLEQTLEYAIQIADALDKAHRQGVVHRDLKPGNIMLVKSGAKLLDFGLAKLQAADTPTNLSALPTEQANLTAEGTILGTLQYMAPEQLEAKEADSRTDIFAFGAVVYEMATGKKAFEGKSQASLIAAILKDDPPPMSELQSMTPPLFDRIVKRCLAKQPDKRWQTASDVMEELKWVTEVGTPVDSVPTAPVTWQRVIPWSIALVAAAIAAVAIWSLTPPASLPLLKFEITPPSTAPLAPGRLTDLAISPDGKRIVYLADREGTSQLYVRSLDERIATPIPGTEGVERGSPFFSPSGDLVAFVADGSLKKVAVTGGLPITLCEAPGYEGGHWGPEEMIVFSASSGGVTGLYRVSAAGGEPESLAMPSAEERGFEYQQPQILHGGDAVLFTVWGRAKNYQATVLSLETREQKIVLEDAKHARYLPTGHLVYAQAQTLMAVSFDLVRLETTGNPIPVLEGVEISRDGEAVDYNFSRNGTLVYVPSGGGVQKRLVWVDRQGRMEPVTDIQRAFEDPRISPDGRRLSVTVRENEVPNVWIYEIARGILTPLTLGWGDDAIWSPDSQRVAFGSRQNDQWNISWMSVEGSGEIEQLTVSDNPQIPRSFSPNGQVLAFNQSSGYPTRADIWVLPLKAERKPQEFLTSEFDEYEAKFSPDGRWLAYISDRSGQFEVYVTSYPAGSGAVQISIDGGDEPLWGPEGTELFYRNGDSVMVVSFRTEPTLEVSTPELLFTGDYVDFDGTGEYDISPDGQKFLMLTGAETVESRGQIHVVLNWFEELKRLVPTDN